ncbi:MIT domain-containing protein 1-like [Microplitis demolitor]|uniref:MIT domain-containing protein 1-like n=1 Tax=Microplitis demolitor TaxID=69319 RepID=UPI0006D4FEFF|nr:MIT domain-containing protein 1-like [Microplitis demolitor]
METAAIKILTRAVDMDKKEQYTLALILYQEGLQVLLNTIKEVTDAKKKDHLRLKAKDYLDRAEKLKEIIEEKKALGQYREQTKIEAGATGYDYDSLFGRFLDNNVVWIHVEDPYIRAYHQCLNLVRLCELAVRKCPSLSKIILTTTQDPEDPKNQISRLQELKVSLQQSNIKMDINFSETLHDRQITLSNGWVIKIGRGLDYFKAPDGKFSLGACDLVLRATLETTVDIFHKNDIKN